MNCLNPPDNPLVLNNTLITRNDGEKSSNYFLIMCNELNNFQMGFLNGGNKQEHTQTTGSELDFIGWQWFEREIRSLSHAAHD